MAGFSQLDAAPHAIEQSRVVSRFQCRDRMARRGLREIQGARGLRHVLSPGDGGEYSQLLEGHIGLRSGGRLARRPSGIPAAGSTPGVDRKLRLEEAKTCVRLLAP